MKITQALILAAGHGTRMGALTAHTPKALLKIANRPLIDYIIASLRAAGMKTIIVNVHAHAEKMIQHLKKTAPDILISDERHQLMDTGGGTAKAFSLLPAAAFLTHNCDSIFPNNAQGSIFKNMAQKFDPQKMDALLLLAPSSPEKGDFSLHPDGRISLEAKNYAYTGVQIISDALIKNPPDGAFAMNVFWRQALARQRLFGDILAETWLHVGTQASLNAARQRAQDIFSPPPKHAVRKSGQ